MPPPTHQLVEHFFRHESANLVAVLTRAFGMGRIDLIEDMVQVAMLEAMQAWKRSGIPDNPAAWIHEVAKHRILDALRREKSHQRAIDATGQTMDDQAALVDRWLEEDQIADSLLRMVFVCCHPSLDRKTQIALTLKTLCGFGISEVARGLMLPSETVKKRIQRAKKALASANVRIELPPAEQLISRLNVVHDVLYLMFNEGYSTTHGTEPIRDDICEEAARLCHLLCESPFSSPATKALLALLLFHSARLEARIDRDGAVILLEDQDRTRWDARLIAAGQIWLTRSKTDQPTTFHFEAAVSKQHCIASSVATTDWETVVRLYDRLLGLRDSPIYAMNRAIAVGQLGDTRQALTQLQQLQGRADMQEYLLLDCAFARMHELSGNRVEAVDCYLAALAKAVAPHEKALLERKLRNLAAP